jgi:hypothetical protein
MLLRDYLLLDLGRVSQAEAGSWRADMTARRQVDASRDLLAFWRALDADTPRLMACAIISLRRFPRAMPLAEFRAGLLEAVRQVLAQGYDLSPAPAGDSLRAGDRTVAGLSVEQHGEVATASLAIFAGAIGEILGGELNLQVLANAVACQFEQAFDYAQAAKHPVACEESLRPRA